MLKPEFLEQLFASFKIASYTDQILCFTPPNNCNETLNEPGLPSQIRVGTTYCLFFKIPPGDTKCGNCPLMTPEERLRELKQNMAETHQ